MAESSEFVDHIRKLRSSRGMTQAQFAKDVGIDQTRISQWELGRGTPSAEALVKLGALAGQSDPAEALFFWERTGLDPKLLISLVDALLRTGQVDAGPLLSTTEAISKQRLTNTTDLEDEGKVVLVPPYADGEWKGWVAPPLPLPSEMVRNIASTFYLVYGKPVTTRYSGGERRGFRDGDLIVFDTSGASDRKFAPFMHQVVIVNLERRLPWGWQDGVFLGRLVDDTRARDEWWIGIEPAADGHYKDYPDFLVRLASFRKQDYLPSNDEIARVEHEYTDSLSLALTLHEYARKEALSTLTLPEGCEIMGRFIALFSGDWLDNYHKSSRIKMRRSEWTLRS